MSAPTENRALSLTAPSPGFSSPLGRAISAAVNKHPALEAVHTDPVTQPTEPVGLGLIVQEAQCEQALGMESPNRRSMLRSPFTLLLNSPVKSPGICSPGLVTRSPSFAFLAANRGFLPTPQIENGATLQSRLVGGETGDTGGTCGLRGAREEPSGSPAFNRERLSGGKRGGSSSGDERARTRVSFEMPQAAIETRAARESGEGGFNRTGSEKPERRESEGTVRPVSAGAPLLEPGSAQAGEGPERGNGDSPRDKSETSPRPLPRGNFSRAEAVASSEEGVSRSPVLEEDASQNGGLLAGPDSPGFCPLENADDFPAVSPVSDGPEAGSPLAPVQSSEQSRETAFFAFSLRATTPEVVKSVSPALTGVQTRSPLHASPAEFANPALTGGDTPSPLHASPAGVPKHVSPVPNLGSNPDFGLEPGSETRAKCGRVRADGTTSPRKMDAGQETGVRETDGVNDPVDVIRAEEDPADVIKRLPPFERGRQRRAALFTPLGPATNGNGVRIGVNQVAAVKEEEDRSEGGGKKRVTRGPVGQLLEVT